MSDHAERAVERLEVENPTDAPTSLFVEPWGYEVLVAPGERVIIEAAGPAGLAGPQGWYLDSWRDESPDGATILTVWAVECWDARVLRADGSIAVDWYGVPLGKYRHLASGAPVEASRPDV